MSVRQLEELLDMFREFHQAMGIDSREARRIGNNEGSVFHRGEQSGIKYAIDAIEKELDK